MAVLNLENIFSPLQTNLWIDIIYDKKWLEFVK